MIEFAGLFWLRPWWWLLVPIGLALGFFVLRRAQDLGAWTRAMDPELLQAMQQMGRITGSTPTRGWVPALVLITLGIALSGPGIERRDAAGFRNLDAVVIVMDLSPSIAEGEHLFDALTAARIIVDRAGTRQVGLVVYAGEAYVAAPLTTDARALMGMFSLIDAETMPLAGSNPTAGIKLAQVMLDEAQILAADVVLISDGGGVDPNTIAVAQGLAGRNAPVSVLHTQTTAELAALSRSGGGAAAPISDPFQVANRIGERLADRLGETGFSMLAIQELGRLLLIVPLLLAVFLLPRRESA